MTAPRSARCGIDRRAGDAGAVVVATAPGRVNLIGEHTDYSGGLALPMAVDLATTVEGRRTGERIVLTSDAAGGHVDLPVPTTANSNAERVGDRDEAASSGWGAYVGAVSEGLLARGQAGGFTGSVRTTLPVGAGLSSSAALEVALALAIGFEGARGELASLARDAEERAVGVPCGLLDQLASVCGSEGHALLIDFTDFGITPVAVPDDLEVVVVHSGQERTLAGSAYAQRRSECEAAAAAIGPLREASSADVAHLGDATLRRRARHVVTENARVLAMVEALRTGDLRTAGNLLTESHRSLRDDFEVSTPVLDALVDDLDATPGVLGARLTGGGFGGCVVAFCEPGILRPGPGVWPLRAADGARVTFRGDPATRPSSPQTPRG